ncbi:protein kinase [Streptomyces zhihengii]|uniref:serine/threonine-protein kinase n=1 Tax=Streptomyces zhihengii TaxID=1818004 RepID=UPI0036BAFFB6
MSGAPGTGRLIAERYRLIGRIGEGVTGVAWLARDELLERDVAVKEVRGPGGGDPAAARALHGRLEHAARTAGRVSHRNVVAVHDVATYDGRPWIVMELVRGLALSEVLEGEGPLPPERAAHIGAEALAGLRAAHASGVAHLDVKPGNVLIANDGRILVTGFGMAAAAGTAGSLGPAAAAADAPGAESDLWSLGALLFTAVEGRYPAGDGPAVAGRAGPALAPVIEGLLRQDPAERMTAAEAEHRLRLASAGGKQRTGAARAVSAPVPPPEAGGEAPEPAGGTPPDTAPAPDGQEGPRHATAVLAGGIAVLVVALAALVWVLAGG